MRRVLITGATSGIGRAAAERFARDGYEVGILAESSAHVEKTVSEIQNAGFKAFGLIVDLSNAADVQGVITRIEADGKPIDVLVNNAGIGLQGDIIETSDSDLRRLFEVNFFAMASLCREAMVCMGARKKGHIINVSSASARRALPGLSAYSSTKAAMHAFSQALRIEAAAIGVSVTELLPMSVKTPFFENAQNKSDKPYEIPTFSTTPEVVAEQIFRAVQRPIPEMYTSQLARFGMAVDGMMPFLFDRVLVKHRKKSMAVKLPADGKGKMIS